MQKEFGEVKSFSVGHTVRQGYYPLVPSRMTRPVIKVVTFYIQIGNGCWLKLPQNPHHSCSLGPSPANPPDLSIAQCLQGPWVQPWFCSALTGSLWELVLGR